MISWYHFVWPLFLEKLSIPFHLSIFPTGGSSWHRGIHSPLSTKAIQVACEPSSLWWTIGRLRFSSRPFVKFLVMPIQLRGWRNLLNVVRQPKNPQRLGVSNKHTWSLMKRPVGFISYKKWLDVSDICCCATPRWWTCRKTIHFVHPKSASQIERFHPFVIPTSMGHLDQCSLALPERGLKRPQIWMLAACLYSDVVLFCCYISWSQFWTIQPSLSMFWNLWPCPLKPSNL